MIKFKHKSKLGVFFSGLFLLATTVSSFGTVTTGTSTTSTSSSDFNPYIKVVAQNDPAELALELTQADIERAGLIASQESGVNLDSEIYMLIGQFEICILSSVLTENANGDAGILMKVDTAGSDATEQANFKYTGTSSSASPALTDVTDGVTMLALYNEATDKKVKYLLHVTPAGYTASDNTFGSESTTTDSYYSTNSGMQYLASSFIIGGDSATTTDPAVLYSLSLNDGLSDTLVTASGMENLALGSWAAVNHYGLNPDLQLGDVVLEGGTAVGGLADAEVRTISAITGGNGCEGDIDPTTGIVNQPMIMKIMLYASAPDMSTASAGDYITKFTINFDNTDFADGNNM